MVSVLPEAFQSKKQLCLPGPWMWFSAVPFALAFMNMDWSPHHNNYTGFH